MFKKIKKLYFKIYHLFKLISVFLVFFSFSSFVNAETCNNLNVSNVWFKASTGNYILNGDPSDDRYFLLSPNTVYTIWFNTASSNFSSFLNADANSFQVWHRWGNNFQAIDDINTSLNYYTFTTQADLNNNNLYYYFRINGNNLAGYTSPFIGDTPTFYLIQGSSPCYFTPPTPEPIDDIFSDFLAVFTDRFIYLTDNFTSNPYLFTFLVIIFSFITLELFFKFIYLKGGRHR